MSEFPYFFSKYGDAEVGAKKPPPTVQDKLEAKLLLTGEDDGATLSDEYREAVLLTLMRRENMN